LLGGALLDGALSPPQPERKARAGRVRWAV
jgi:hypothetical protein